MFKDPNDDSVGHVEQTIAIQEDKKIRGIEPIPHRGPMKGPLDWYISFGMLGGVFGLLRDGDVGGIVGIGVGVGLIALWNLFMWIASRSIKLALSPFGPRKEAVVKRKSAYESVDWKKYEREKKAREAAELKKQSR